MAGQENSSENTTTVKPNAMHLKDYLERQEEFRSLMHLRLIRSHLRLTEVEFLR